MLKFLSRILGGERPEAKDAKYMYQKTMQHARNTAFYGPQKFGDTYDGRMEVLCMHLAIFLYHLRKFDENGKKLSQALYDVMIADFDIALREEGLSDTGVSRRIKPMAKMFFERAKVYAEILEAPAPHKEALGVQLGAYILTTHKDMDVAVTKSVSELAQYVDDFSNRLAGKTLGDIASMTSVFPTLD